MTFDRLRTLLLFLAIGVAAALMPAQADTWWHLRAGQEMWRTHALLTVDTFSHTVAGTYWPNHEWLFEVLLYPVFAAGGVALVTLVCAAAATAAWIIVWREIPAPPRIRFMLMAGVLISAVGTWSPRPQVFSLLLLTVTVALLRRRRYAWLPIIFLGWANLHGAVVIGGVVVAAAFAAAIVEDRAAAIRFAPWAAATFAATLVTPMGIHFWIAIVQSLGRIRMIGIDEWAPPRLGDVAMLPFWITAAALVGLVLARGRGLLGDEAARRDGQITICICALALLPPAIGAVRNVPPFLLIAVPAIAALARSASATNAPRHEDQLLSSCFRVFRASEDDRSVAAPRANLALAIAAAAASIVVVALSYTRSAPHLNWQPLPPRSLAALDACHGNLYNRYDEGGYLIWFAPAHRVFLDGRQDPFPPALIEDQRRVEQSGNYDDLFRRYRIDCAYLPADSIVAARLASDGWRSLYQDDHQFTVLAR
ncbi:MAG TPA: hypothetical protein VNG89_26500 [Vicinamibacterales bacterium]|nr:hypothetical protein [Vicinamibacterales bacterium]